MNELWRGPRKQKHNFKFYASLFYSAQIKCSPTSKTCSASKCLGSAFIHLEIVIGSDKKKGKIQIGPDNGVRTYRARDVYLSFWAIEKK